MSLLGQLLKTNDYFFKLKVRFQVGTFVFFLSAGAENRFTTHNLNLEGYEMEYILGSSNVESCRTFRGVLFHIKQENG